MSAGLERIRFRGVEGMRCGRFSGKVNTSVFVFRQGSTLIDSGPPNQWAEVRAFVGEEPLDLILASHHHEDHSGNLAPLKKATGVTVMAPRESLRQLAGGFAIQPYRRLVWGVPERLEAESLPRRVDLPGGGRLEAVLLPGHSPDMTCLLDAERGILFGADLYVSRRLRYLRADEDLPLLVASLRRALELDFDTLLCSHRGVVEDARERLGQKIDHLISLGQRAAELEAKGLPFRRIVRRLAGREDRIGWLSLGHYSKANLVRGALALGRDERVAGGAA